VTGEGKVAVKEETQQAQQVVQERQEAIVETQQQKTEEPPTEGTRTNTATETSTTTPTPQIENKVQEKQASAQPTQAPAFVSPPLVPQVPAQVNQEVKVSQPKQVVSNELGPLRPVVRKSGSGSGVQSQGEEAWVNVLKPEKKKVIDCKELDDECRFYQDWEELREWRSWSGEHIFEPPEPELKDIISPQTHERLHKQLYELVINGKQQEALKLWEEFFNDTLLPKLVKLGEDTDKQQ
jgi:hypothetical protein